MAILIEVKENPKFLSPDKLTGTLTNYQVNNIVGEKSYSLSMIDPKMLLVISNKHNSDGEYNHAGTLLARNFCPAFDKKREVHGNCIMVYRWEIR